MNQTITTKRQRVFTGTVVSKKTDKTAIVEIVRFKVHQKYHKKYKQTARFTVDDPVNTCVLGQTVNFVEVRPLSKNKRWRVVSASVKTTPTV